MKRALSAALCAAALACAWSAGAATNLGFETGDLDGWTAQGKAGAAPLFTNQTQDWFITPKSGQYFGFVVADQENVFQTIRQTFSLVQGATITGWAGFAYNDYDPYWDDGYLSVNGTNLLYWLAPNVFDFTGWQQFTFTAPSDGLYTLELGVANRGEFPFPGSTVAGAPVGYVPDFEGLGHSSVAAIDGVTITVPGDPVSGPPVMSPAPEPATWAFLIAGFGLVGGALRQRQSPALG